MVVYVPGDRLDGHFKVDTQQFDGFQVSSYTLVQKIIEKVLHNTHTLSQSNPKLLSQMERVQQVCVWLKNLICTVASAPSMTGSVFMRIKIIFGTVWNLFDIFITYPVQVVESYYYYSLFTAEAYIF